MTDPLYVLDAPEPVRPLLARALADLGARETAPNVVPDVSDGEPWCALIACQWLQLAGVPIPRIAGAREVMIWLGTHGHSIPHDGPLVAGDVVGWERYEGGHVVGAHVSIVLASGPGWLDVIAGNSGARADRVAITLVGPGKVQWAARPMG